MTTSLHDEEDDDDDGMEILHSSRRLLRWGERGDYDSLRPSPLVDWTGGEPENSTKTIRRKLNSTKTSRLKQVD